MPINDAIAPTSIDVIPDRHPFRVQNQTANPRSGNCCEIPTEITVMARQGETLFMQFPLWQYLKQPLFEAEQPIILNPYRYWQAYKVMYLKRCIDNAFLERCWHCDYRDFVTKHRHWVDRNYLEENHLALLEACWQRHPRYRGRSRHRYFFEDF